MCSTVMIQQSLNDYVHKCNLWNDHEIRVSKLNCRSNGGFSNYTASSAEFWFSVLLTCAYKGQQLELISRSKEDNNAIKSPGKGGGTPLRNHYTPIFLTTVSQS